jgi:hypothetical protein
MMGIVNDGESGALMTYLVDFGQTARNANADGQATSYSHPSTFIHEIWGRGCTSRGRKGRKDQAIPQRLVAPCTNSVTA